MEARDEKRLLRLQKQLAKYSLLVIDELGFVPLSKTGAELLFEVFSQGYERAVGDLEVAFADPEWGGEALPEGMWCDRYEGSNAMSPSLLVAGVPTDANAIIVNFNDEMVFSWMKAVVTGRSDFGSNRQRRSGCRPSHQIRASWAPKFLSNTAHLFRSV